MPHVYAWGFLGQERRVTPQLLDGHEDTTALVSGGFTFGALVSPRGLSIIGGLGVVNEAALSTPEKENNADVVGGCGYDHCVYGTPQQLTEGSLFGFGHNAHGQAVPGCADVDVAVPRAFPALPSRVAQVACGERHTLLLTDHGHVFAFGDNSNGQLGSSGTGDARAGPCRVELASAVTSVACGARHSLFALSGTGGVAACGWNLYGQCGTGDNLDVRTPRPVSGLSGMSIRGVGAGISHSACLTPGGDVYVWGYMSGCKLIPSDDEPQHASPVALTPHLLECPALDGGIRAVRCGARHLVALRDDGCLLAWGCNSMGQLGTGDTKARTSSAPHVLDTAAMPPVVDVQCGWWHTLVLTE
jgi:alpha-tubulin suppressor-like RCC1 family protein